MCLTGSYNNNYFHVIYRHLLDYEGRNRKMEYESWRKQVCCKMLSFPRCVNNFILLDKNLFCLSFCVHFCMCKEYVMCYKIRVIKREKDSKGPSDTIWSNYTVKTEPASNLHSFAQGLVWVLSIFMSSREVLNGSENCNRFTCLVHTNN